MNVKVLNVNITIDPLIGGGTAERTYQMTRWLNELKVECKILVLDFEAEEEQRFIDKTNIIKLKCINKRFYIPKFELKKVSDAVKNTDVIHMMSHWTILNILVYLFARMHNKPYIFCPAGALKMYGRSRFLKLAYNKVIGKRIIKNSAACIAITKDEIQEIYEHGVSESRIFHIPNGISQQDFATNDIKQFRRKYDLNDRKIILYVGRLNTIKGIDILFNAFLNIHSRFPNFQLVIAGPDEGLAEEMNEKIYSNKLEKQIKLIGYVRSEFKSSAYSAASLLVIPSRHEAMSIVVLEAGITGKPVLITDQCGFNEVQEVNGGRVVQANVKSIENGLLDLLTNENQLIEMGFNLRTYIEKNYLWTSIAKLHLELFNNIINKKIYS